MTERPPILVTGAAGLIGRTLVERLLADGRAVMPVDRLPVADDALYEVTTAELTDVHRLYALVAAGVDGIIHCGGISGPALGRDHPAGVAAVNVGGTVNLLEAARLFGVRRFVFCSSIVAYGATPAGLDLVDETAPLTATADVYGASKAAADLLVRAFAAQHGLDARIGRIGWVYGPRRQTPSLLGGMVRSGLEGRPLTFDHDGTYALQLVHVDDVAAGLLAIYDAPELLAQPPASAAGRAFNITGGTCIRVLELAALVTAACPSADIRFTPGRAMAADQQALFSLSALRSLGWQPRVALDAGIARYAAWLARHPF